MENFQDILSKGRINFSKGKMLCFEMIGLKTQEISLADEVKFLVTFGTICEILKLILHHSNR
jgi:hypothetical protein